MLRLNEEVEGPPGTEWYLPLALADPEVCGLHPMRRSARKVLNLKVGWPLDRVLALAVLNSGPGGAVAAHLFQKKRAAGGPNLIAQIVHPVGMHWPRAAADT